MWRALTLGLLLVLPLSAQGYPQKPESIVAGLSQNLVSITANFTGSEILVYGAVRREAPAPAGPPLEVIVTVQGPSGALKVRRKERIYGIWMNAAEVTISRAPSFYAIASSAPLETALSSTEDLRYQVSIPRAIRSVGITSEARDAPAFVEALVRLQREDGNYSSQDGNVSLQQETLFRTDIALPANLTEGDYAVRIFITRGGKVIDLNESVILVNKAGFERWLYNLAHQLPLVYGLLSLLLAVTAGWGASAIFGLLRR